MSSDEAREEPTAVTSACLAARVSVIVPTHQRAAMLVQCLEALTKQTVIPREIIVVDDGSTDDTPAVAARYGPLVRYIRTEAQSGKSVAVNLALEAVQGDFVWVFDDDDVALPTAVAQLQAPLIADDALGFTFGHFTFAVSSPDGTIKSREIESLVPDVAERGLLAPLLEVNYLGGARMMFRTTALRAIGGFDPVYLRSQDFDVAVRMTRAYRGARAPGSPLYLYRVHLSVRKSGGRVTAGAQLEHRWLEYDRRIVSELFKSMPLEELLPPINGGRATTRELLLQRAGIFASRVMFDEMLGDFHAIAELRDDSPLTSFEREQAERLFYFSPMYDLGDVIDDATAVSQMKALSQRSSAVRQIIRHAATAAPLRSAAMMLSQRKPRRSWRILRTALVFGPLSAST